jgi:hypothetical protein
LPSWQTAQSFWQKIPEEALFPACWQIDFVKENLRLKDKTDVHSAMAAE